MRAAAIALAVALAGCGPPAPDVLLVTFDTTRHDAVGFAGDPEARTPHLDALAARGRVFTRAAASTGVTLPSHTTIHTGLEPPEHGIRANGRSAVPLALDTLAERLSAAGYATGAFVSAWVLAPVFRLDQGFDHYGAETRRTGAHPLDASVAQRPAEEVTDEALAWLAGQSAERPVFVWAHYYDPHLPREVRPSEADLLDPYAAEIARADAEFGRLLAGLGSLRGGREPLVVFTADHGEAFGAHGEATHALLAYESTLHVPLVLAGPGVPRGSRSDVLARHVDLVPTVLARLELPPDPALPGRDLLAEPGEEPLGWFESRSPHASLGWAPIEGVRTTRWKYTATPEPTELYDLAADPGETNDVREREPDVVARLERAYRALQGAAQRSGKSAGVVAEPAELSAEQREGLAALGYVEAPAHFERGKEPDPPRWARAHGVVEQARAQAQAGRHDEAIDALRAIAESRPLRPLALRWLAPILREAGRLEDSIAAWRAYLETGGTDEARRGLAETLLQAGRAAEALTELADPPATARAATLRARALTAIGRIEDARGVLDAFAERRAGHVWGRRQRGLLVLEAAPLPDGEQELRALAQADPDDAVLRSMLGFHVAVWGGPERRTEALALLREAARDAPAEPEVWSQLGWGAYRAGEIDEAVSALERALALEPGRHQDEVRLGFALRARGEDARARTLLESGSAARPGAPWAAEARRALTDLDASAAEATREGGT